jgi:endonuclease YncB( thermonuclease family)
MFRPLRLGAASLACVLTCLLAASTATAAPSHGACIAGHPGRCEFWYGRLKSVGDGDTIDVRIRGIGVRRIRMTGINAMELTRYSHTPSKRRGACHAKAAAARLEQLLHEGHGRIRLAAQHASSHAGHRLRREVATWIGGRWLDTGAVLVNEGYALWLPNGHEWAWNRLYSALSERAAAARLNLWNPFGCGHTPAASADLRLRVRYDAKGNDRSNPNGEWFRVRNLSAFAVRIGGWWVRDSSHRQFRFPHGAVIPARGRVTVRVGPGRDTARTYHWNQPQPVFENPTRNRRALGDGGYLFDRRGNLRAYMIYPHRAL